MPQAQTETVSLSKEVLAELLQNIALTPEKLREALKPYQDPAVVARELREREQSRRQFLADRAATRARQQACPHKDKNERWSINLQHNFPDHMPRGICPLCHDLIEPAHWEIPGAGFDGGNGKGEPYVVQEHPLYHVVRFLESQS